MKKIKVSEIFYSVQGEGRFVGVPSVFLRTFGCNFTCSSFGLPVGTETTEPDEIASKVHLYKNFTDLPLANFGCDSYASWHPKFKHLSPSYEVEQLVDALLKLTPNNKWMQNNGNDVHLVITGGEPLLGWQQLYPELLSHAKMRDLRNLTFETNGTQPLHKEFKDFLINNYYLPRNNITFSVSPKLTASGEEWRDAIKPDVVKEYEHRGFTYLKFVIDKEEDFEEVDHAVAEYRAVGFTGPVFVMPVGGTDETYANNMTVIANLALVKGYCFSPRLHVTLFGNGWGT